jgi:hypothetical protein
MHRLFRIHCRGAPCSPIRPLFGVPKLLRLFRGNRFVHQHLFACQNTTLRTTFRASFRRIRQPRLLIAFSAAATLPLIARIDNDSTQTTSEKERTLEQELLATSDEERRAQIYGVNKNRSIFYRFFRRIKVAFIRFIFEPIATGLRFIQLIIFFVPVFATIPLTFLGSRDPSRDNERYGTLWWYNFLVRQMERAGPTFIKVLTVL